MDNTKDKIFKTAVYLFSTKGYKGSSMREIAQSVGIRESSLYNHFSGKKALLQAILDFQMESFQNSMVSLDELKKSMPETTDPVEFWLSGTMAFLKAKNPLTEPISKIIINEMFLNDQCREFILKKLYTAQKDLTEMIFTVMHEKNMIIDCPIRETAVQYVYMIQGLEMENKLMMLEGQSQDESLGNLIKHMTLFIERIKK